MILKSKEEILKPFRGVNGFEAYGEYGEKLFSEALDEYGEQLSIAFAEWLGNYENGNAVTPRVENGEVVWFLKNGEAFCKGDTKSVFQLFLTTLTDK